MMAFPSLNIMVMVPDGMEKMLSWTFLIQTEMSEPFRIFSKKMPAKPEQTVATTAARKPTTRLWS